jgi:hypothetical protein
VKNEGIHINLFLGILMLAASLLPALHASTHLSSSESAKNMTASELAINFSQAAVDCDLCDFTFSSADEPEIFLYNIDLPEAFNKQDTSLTETIFLLPQTTFSLRAPPVTIA